MSSLTTFSSSLLSPRRSSLPNLRRPSSKRTRTNELPFQEPQPSSPTTRPVSLTSLPLPPSQLEPRLSPSPLLPLLLDDPWPSEPVRLLPPLLLDPLPLIDIVQPSEVELTTLILSLDLQQLPQSTPSSLTALLRTSSTRIPSSLIRLGLSRSRSTILRRLPSMVLDGNRSSGRRKATTSRPAAVPPSLPRRRCRSTTTTLDTGSPFPLASNPPLPPRLPLRPPPPPPCRAASLLPTTITTVEDPSLPARTPVRAAHPPPPTPSLQITPSPPPSRSSNNSTSHPPPHSTPSTTSTPTSPNPTPLPPPADPHPPKDQ